jgi:hypothetical protein
MTSLLSEFDLTRYKLPCYVRSIQFPQKNRIEFQQENSPAKVKDKTQHDVEGNT